MRYVVVTDKIRGVYFGETPAKDGDTYVVLYNARICFSWAATEGLGELVTKGPATASKIGPVMPRMCISDVANVFDCTPEAVTRWQAAKWA